MEKLIKAGHLKSYVKEIDQGSEPRQDVERIAVGAIAPSEPRSAINYILGGLSDNQYQSKHQQKKLLTAVTIKARVNVIHIVLHYDALVLILCINGFDVHRVLVDPGSVVDLLQQPAFRQMKLSSKMLNLAG